MNSNTIDAAIQNYKAVMFLGLDEKEDNAYCHLKGTTSNIIVSALSIVNDNNDKNVSATVRDLIYDIAFNLALSNNENCKLFMERLNSIQQAVEDTTNKECKVININNGLQ